VVSSFLSVSKLFSTDLLLRRSHDNIVGIFLQHHISIFKCLKAYSFLTGISLLPKLSSLLITSQLNSALLLNKLKAQKGTKRQRDRRRENLH